MSDERAHICADKDRSERLRTALLAMTEKFRREGQERYRAEAEVERLQATADELRKIIVDSADACTRMGCEHCKWLGWHLGRYESLVAAGRAQEPR